MKRLLSFMVVLVLMIGVGSTCAYATGPTAMSLASYVGEDETLAIVTSTEKEQDMQIAGTASATKNKAIVIIPGVGASVLRNAQGDICWVWLLRVSQLECNTSGNSINTIVPGTGDYGVGFPNYYKALYDELNKEYGTDYQVLFFPYDWRLSNADTAKKLATATKNYDELILVAHSMGGLVASSFCTTAANRDKVDKLITLGTPYTGTPQLLYVAETGDFDIWASLAAFGNGQIKNLVKNFHCTYQLAPTERYGNNYGTYIKKGTVSYSGSSARSFYAKRPWATLDGTSIGTTKPMFSSATSFHSSLIISGTHIANSSLVDTYKIVGKGKDTKSLIIYDENGNYKDFEANNSGDGTVPRYSASNTQSITSANKVYEVTSDHMGLIKSTEVFSYIKRIINGSISTTASVSTNSDNMTVNDKGWLIGEDNKRIYITASASTDITIADMAGNPVSVSDGFIYDCRGNEIGYVGVVGDNGLKYCLHNGAYTFKMADDHNIPLIKVEYQDNGYYEYVISYENLNLSDVLLTIPAYGDFEVACVAVNSDGYSAYTAKNIIDPTHIMTEAELAERNNF